MVSLNKAKNILRKHYKKQLNFAQKSGIQRAIDRVNQKYNHSYGVLETGKELIAGDKELSLLDKKTQEIMNIVCILHDVARFHEVEEGKLGGFSHGEYGAFNILRDIEGIDNPLILLPIKYHDRLDFEGLNQEITELGCDDQKDLIFLIARFIKDADKMTNFRYFSKINYISHSTKRELYISDEVLRQFRERELVNKKFCETVFDIAINFISWQFDLNFDISREIFVKENLNEILLEKFKRVIEVIAKEREKDYNKSEIDRQKNELNEGLSIIRKVLDENNY